jgi:hypothetical protein
MRRGQIKRKPKIFPYKKLLFEKALENWEKQKDSWDIHKNPYWRECTFFVPTAQKMLMIRITKYITGPARLRVRDIKIWWSNYKHLTPKEIHKLL